MTRSTSIIYNTVDRVLRGDMFHTVTRSTVIADMAAYPPDWPVVGVGTTNWLKRHGEVIVEGTAGELRFLWSDPNSEPEALVLDLRREKPEDGLVTPQFGVDDNEPNFAFLALAICNPASAFTLDLGPVENAHLALRAQLEAQNLGVAGVQLGGSFDRVRFTAAYHLPLTGIDLSKGHVGDDYFRTGETVDSEWVMSGLYAANPSLHPLFSVPNVPLHLHGYSLGERRGGHINSAAAGHVVATIWPVDDLTMKLFNVARAMNPVRPEAQEANPPQ
ncbi:MAG: hypothetical protein U0452_13315 [Anaerolineae bacterium]